ncbi:MAG: hypothetical protein ABR874_17800 [Candidatus Sulfotelmatobacter sp.]
MKRVLLLALIVVALSGTAALVDGYPPPRRPAGHRCMVNCPPVH